MTSTDGADDAERLLNIIEPEPLKALGPGLREAHPSEARILYGWKPHADSKRPSFTMFTNDAAGIEAWSKAAAVVAADQERARREQHGGNTAEPPVSDDEGDVSSTTITVRL